MSNNIVEENPTQQTNAPSGPQGQGAGGGQDKVRKQARQLAYDVRYKVKQGFKDGQKTDPASLKRAFVSQLGKSPAPGPVKQLAKTMLVGESYDFVDVTDTVNSSVANAIKSIFVENKKACEICGSFEHLTEDCPEEVNEALEQKKYKVRVTDKKSGKSYTRFADRDKISELRKNPNISSVEMTGYGTPYEGEKNKGEQTAATKSGKSLDGDDKKRDSMKEHHTKDADGNPIPHDEVDEGVLVNVAKEAEKVGGAAKRKVKSGVKKAVKGTARVVGKGIKKVAAATARGAAGVVGGAVKGAVVGGYKGIKKGLSEEELREHEFIGEVNAENENPSANPKKIDVMKGKNKIKINPNMGEQVENDQNDQKDEKPKMDPKEKRVAMMKRAILQKKMQAVKGGAGADIVAHNELEGEVISEKEVKVKDTKKVVDAIRAYDKSKDASRDATADSDEGKTGKAAKERKYAAKERGEIDKDDPNWKKRKYHTGMHGESYEKEPPIKDQDDKQIADVTFDGGGPDGGATIKGSGDPREIPTFVALIKNKLRARGILVSHHVPKGEVVSEKKADKDYDGDGKVESGKDEYFGSKDKAIKKAMGKKHDCASKVKHEEYGLGDCIKGMHDLDESGNVAHYDVFFEHGVEKNVDVSSLEILEYKMHEHVIRDGEQLDELNKRERVEAGQGKRAAKKGDWSKQKAKTGRRNINRFETKPVEREEGSLNKGKQSFKKVKVLNPKSGYSKKTDATKGKVTSRKLSPTGTDSKPDYGPQKPHWAGNVHSDRAQQQRRSEHKAKRGVKTKGTVASDIKKSMKETLDPLVQSAVDSLNSIAKKEGLI